MSEVEPTEAVSCCTGEVVVYNKRARVIGPGNMVPRHVHFHEYTPFGSWLINTVSSSSSIGSHHPSLPGTLIMLISMACVGRHEPVAIYPINLRSVVHPSKARLLASKALHPNGFSHCRPHQHP